MVVSLITAMFFYNFFSEVYCEAKRWKPSDEPIADPALYQRFSKPPFPQPSPEAVELDLAIYQNLLNLHRLFHQNPIEPDLDLYQNLPELSPATSQEPCWTWAASVPKPPRHSLEPFPEPFWTWPDSTPYWIWPGSAPKPPEPFPGLSELFPESRWTWPGACASPHRSNSGLKIPLAYAIGEYIFFRNNNLNINKI